MRAGWGVGSRWRSLAPCRSLRRSSRRRRPAAGDEPDAQRGETLPASSSRAVAISHVDLSVPSDLPSSSYHPIPYGHTPAPRFARCTLVAHSLTLALVLRAAHDPSLHDDPYDLRARARHRAAGRVWHRARDAPPPPARVEAARRGVEGQAVAGPRRLKRATETEAHEKRGNPRTAPQLLLNK